MIYRGEKRRERDRKRQTWWKRRACGIFVCACASECTWQWWSTKQKRPPTSPINTLSPLTPTPPQTPVSGSLMEARLWEHVCVRVCFHMTLFSVACVHLHVHRKKSWRVCEYREKTTPKSGGSLHSRLCRAPGAALFIRTANLHFVCVYMRVFSCVSGYTS